jgi:pimeloyl-ACP methyl ester carboxylesterase
MVSHAARIESRFITLASGQMHYLDAGQGETVVCLHGNPTSSFFFRSVIRELMADYRILAPDHLGCGRSSHPDEVVYGYRLADRTADLGEFLEKLSLRDRLTFVLHDWGGMIGLLYAVRHLDRVSRIVLLNTAGFGLPQSRRLPWSLRLCRLPYLGALLVRGLNLFCRGAARYCVCKAPLGPEARAEYLTPYGSWQNRLAVLRFVQDIPLEPTHASFPLLREVEARLDLLRRLPCLVCWAGHDFVFDRAFLEEWERRWPEAEFELYPEAGHYLLEDEPFAVPQRIRRFLEEHPLPVCTS